MIVIDDAGTNLGVLTKADAIVIAKEKDLDLVLVSPNAQTPVAKIVDWAKFKYEKSKKLRKNKGKTLESKEWWFKPSIEDRDIKLKLQQVKRFVDKGGMAKLTIKYVPRTPIEAIRGAMDRLLNISQELVKITSEVTKEGKNLSILVKTK